MRYPLFLGLPILGCVQPRRRVGRPALSSPRDPKVMQNTRYIILSFLSAAVFLGLAVTGLTAPLLARLEVSDPQVLGLNASTLFGFAIMAVTFMVLVRNKLAYGFTDEVIVELVKVTWPTKQETIRSTTVVVVFSIIVAGALAAYDYVWAGITSELLFTEG
jgi:preprotein translocase SecE subunit